MIDPRFEKTTYIVEADSFAQLKLWEEFNQRVVWKQDCKGLYQQVGSFDDMPVNISCNWNILDGYHILFWEAISQVVDYRMVDKFFDWVFGENFQNKTNAMNFAHVLQFIEKDKF